MKEAEGFHILVMKKKEGEEGFACNSCLNLF